MFHDDSDYSHGTEITYLETHYKIKPFDRWGINVLQNMYTPDNIASDELQVGDRPYCGLLLVSFIGDKIYHESFLKGNISVRHVLGAGTTGDASCAEESQRVVHKIIGSRKPNGWTYQIAEEPIVQYQGYIDWNIPIFKSQWFSIYGIPRGYLMVGNFRDQIGLGFDLKMGMNSVENIGANYAFSAPANPMSYREYVESKRNNPVSMKLYLLGGTEGKFVLWDTSLDGTMFRDSIYTVDSEKWVGEFHVGAGLGCKYFDFKSLVVFRSKEYEEQDESSIYGRFSLAINF